MKGKVTVELEYWLNEGGTHLVFRHPDLEHTLTLPYTGQRLMQVQLDSINLNRSKTPLEGLISDSQEFMEAAQGLKQMIPELLTALKGKK